MAEPTLGQLSVEFRDLSDFLREGGSAAEARQGLVDLACAVVPGCDWAGITIDPPNARPRTLTCSGDTALQLDLLQYELGDGPCMEAARADEPAGNHVNRTRQQIALSVTEAGELPDRDLR